MVRSSLSRFRPGRVGKTETLPALLKDYGLAVYISLFAYCALKSGALPLFGSYAAHAGALDLSLVAMATFAGGYLGDELRFALARRFGDGFAQGRPRITRMLNTPKKLLERYGAAYIFLYRHPNGRRTVGALPVGLTAMTWTRFSCLNAASAAVWTTSLVGAGYLFGEIIKQAAADGWGLLSVALLIAFVGLSVFGWWRMSHLEDGNKV